MISSGVYSNIHHSGYKMDFPFLHSTYLFDPVFLKLNMSLLMAFLVCSTTVCPTVGGTCLLTGGSGEKG